jgi:hypothetical protein
MTLYQAVVVLRSRLVACGLPFFNIPIPCCCFVDHCVVRETIEHHSSFHVYTPSHLDDFRFHPPEQDEGCFTDFRQSLIVVLQNKLLSTTCNPPTTSDFPDASYLPEPNREGLKLRKELSTLQATNKQHQQPHNDHHYAFVHTKNPENSMCPAGRRSFSHLLPCLDTLHYIKAVVAV